MDEERCVVLRIAIESAFVVGCLVLGAVIEDPVRQVILGCAIGALLPLLLDSAVYARDNRRYIGILFKAKIRLRKDERIRFSMSYQYRILVDGRYMLVRSDTFDWYQPVGGKYKRLPESQSDFDKMRIGQDDRLPISGRKEYDLAVLVPRNSAGDFMRWFRSQQGREISHFREFYEELLGGDDPILTPKLFPYINYRFAGSVLTPLFRSPPESGWHCWEVLRIDVLDLIPTPSQLDALRKTMNQDDDRLIWADAEQINRQGYDVSKKGRSHRIAAHAKWGTNLEWSKE